MIQTMRGKTRPREQVQTRGWYAAPARFVIVACLAAATGCGGETTGGNRSGGTGGSGGGDSCFVAGTNIATPDGPVAIDELAVGDEVLSYDLAKQRVVTGIIEHVFRHEGATPATLALDDGTLLGVTPEHPIYFADSGAFLPAMQASDFHGVLRLGSNGHVSAALAEQFEPAASGAPQVVYNLSVSGRRNFFAEGVLVHNKTFPPRPPPCELDGTCFPPDAQPCESDTGFAYDEACVLPPLDGFQLHFGPSSYTEPVELSHFLLLPGAEATDCVFVQGPAIDAPISSLKVRARGDSNVLVRLFRASPDQPTSPLPAACGSTLGFEYVVGSWGASADTPPSGFPESTASWRSFAGDVLAIEVAATNTTDAVLVREAWINGTYATSPGMSIFAPVRLVALPPDLPVGAESAATATCAPAEASQLVALSSTHHDATRSVTAGSDSETLGTWFGDDPSILYFADGVVNETPDAALRRSGGPSGTAFLGASLTVTCDFQNESRRAISFGSRLYSDASCELFGLVLNEDGAPLGCDPISGL